MARTLSQVGLGVAVLVVVGGVGQKAGRADDKAPGEVPASILFARLSPSVVVVETTQKSGSSQGSGVTIGKEQIVTNWHVVDGATTVAVRRGAQRLPATVQAFDPKHDLAILRVPGLDSPRVPLRASTLVRVGERAIAIGAPHGLELSLSDGLVSALRPEHQDGRRDGKETGVSILQTTAPVSPGSSGGGLFDSHGRLIGVTTFSTSGQNLNFAHPTEWITELLDGKRGSAKPAERAPAGPRYSLSERPEALHCTLRTATTWGLFSSGPELLATRDIAGSWDFDHIHTQLPRALPVPPFTIAEEYLVLSDMNRQSGYVRFSPRRAELKAEYFFFVDDDGSFQMAVLQPEDFHGQVRANVTFGSCEPLLNADLWQRRAAVPANPYP